MSESAKADVVVLGAGIVGVSVAYAARERGLSVTLIDRCEPGCETSYGNAGVLSSGSIFPFNRPSLFTDLPAYLTNRHAALRWNPIWAARNAGWLLRYLANAAPARVRPRAIALQGLIGASLKLHREWIVGAGAAMRLRETGWLKVWRRAGIAAAKAECESLTAYGIRCELLDCRAICALEPDLKSAYMAGLLFSGSASVDSPMRVVQAYARMFAASGGRLLRAEVRALLPEVDGWRVQHGSGALCARHVVVALGPWSAELLRPLGYRMPLAFERGYHQEFTVTPSRLLRRPFHDVQGGFVMTPMGNCIRITTGVELTARDAPSSFAQLDTVVSLARSVVEFGDPVGPPWRGARPTLPDSLPMIGAAPRHTGLWLALGHQHIGFTCGPATGAAITAMICRAPAPFDVTPFSPARYL